MIKHTGNGLGSDPLPWGASWEVYMGEPNQIITFEHKLTSFSKFTRIFLIFFQIPKKKCIIVIPCDFHPPSPPGYKVPRGSSENACVKILWKLHGFCAPNEAKIWNFRDFCQFWELRCPWLLGRFQKNYKSHLQSEIRWFSTVLKWKSKINYFSRAIYLASYWIFRIPDMHRPTEK